MESLDLQRVADLLRIFFDDYYEEWSRTQHGRHVLDGKSKEEWITDVYREIVLKKTWGTRRILGQSHPRHAFESRKNSDHISPDFIIGFHQLAKETGSDSGEKFWDAFQGMIPEAALSLLETLANERETRAVNDVRNELGAISVDEHKREVKELEEKISTLHDALNTKETESAVLQKELERVKPFFSAPVANPRAVLVITYFSFATILFLLSCVIYWSINANPEISVEVNVGEIIGGSLVGLGVALAGGAYAVTALNPKSGRD